MAESPARKTQQNWAKMPTNSTILSLLAIALLVALSYYKKIDFPKGEANTLQPSTAHGYYDSFSESTAPIPAQIPEWAFCFPTCRTPMSSGTPLDTNMATSQSGEDIWVYNNLFYGKRNGIFLEMGALDGIKYSNTLWMEQEAGWRGVLIEPSLGSYSKLTKNRPNALMFNVAICSDFRTVHYVEGNRSAATNGIWEFMGESYRQRYHPDVTDVSQLREVSCVPLHYLLARFGVYEIDFWSLDVEGGELEVLRAFDFSQIKVNTMVVETAANVMEKKKEIVNLLENAGLRQVYKDGKNRFFVHSSYLKHISTMPGHHVGPIGRNL